MQSIFLDFCQNLERVCGQGDINSVAPAAVSRAMMLHRARGGLNTNRSDRAQHAVVAAAAAAGVQ